ncbi:hypothetical protein H0O02_04485, partial [Candidatus Micrarchaeota archaeon]|nr:hypothetical protein [Candidatus Micrarchaeota archaeon]
EVKKFSTEMVKSLDEKGEKISNKEVEERLDGIAGLLFECYRRWKDSPVIDTAMQVLGGFVYNAVTQIEARFVKQSTGDINNVHDPTVREMIQDAANKTAGEYVAIATHKLQLRIAKEIAKETEGDGVGNKEVN